MTVTTVSDGQKRNPNADEMECYLRREWDLRRRFLEGSLSPGGLLVSIQHLAEGCLIRTEDIVLDVSTELAQTEIVLPSDQELFTIWMSKQTEFWGQFDITPNLDGPNVPKDPIGDFCLPIWNPGTMNDEELAAKVLKRFRPYWVSVPLMDYSEAAATGKPSLVLARNTIEPDKIHRGKSSNDARAYAQKHKAYFLNRQHYIILFAFHVFVTGKELDVKGWTRFPENRLSGGYSANGHWLPTYSEVLFYYDDSDSRDVDVGPREGKFFSL